MIETEEKTPMSRREDLIEAVILVQKHLETPTDIVTFCARKGVSVAEIEWHLEYYIRRVQKETDAKIGQFRRITRSVSLNSAIVLCPPALWMPRRAQSVCCLRLGEHWCDSPRSWQASD